MSGRPRGPPVQYGHGQRERRSDRGASLATVEGARAHASGANGREERNVGRCLSGGNRAGELRLFRAVIAGVGGHDEIACSPTSSSSFASSLATARSLRHRPPLTDAAPDPTRKCQEENLRKNLRRQPASHSPSTVRTPD